MVRVVRVVVEVVVGEGGRAKTTMKSTSQARRIAVTTRRKRMRMDPQRNDRR